MNRSPLMRRNAVTLTEMLVVVSIIGILATLTFTGFQYAKKGTENQNGAIQAVQAKVARSQATAFRKTLPSAKSLPGSHASANFGAAARPNNGPKDFGAVPQEYVILFAAGVSDAQSEAARLASTYQGVVLKVFTNIAKAAVLWIPDKNFSAFRNDPKIAALEKNAYGVLCQQKIPTGFARTFSYPSLPANQLFLRIPTPVNTARNIQFGQSVVSGYQMVNVAVIDSGIDSTHPDLNVVMSLQCSDTPPTQDIIGHGTKVAGTIGARNNTFGTVGIYPGAPLWSLRIDNADGTQPVANTLQALSYVYDYSATIRVANVGQYFAKNAVLDAFANQVAQKGVIIVAPAGNDTPARALASGFSPASAGNVVCVGAMGDSDGKPGGKGPNTSDGADDTMATFSNYGSAVHVLAPGVDIYTTYTVAQGSYGTVSGASMASAHVSGYLALLLDSKTIFGANNRNLFVTAKPTVAANAPAFVRAIATESIPGILGDTLFYPMVNFRLQ